MKFPGKVSFLKASTYYLEILDSGGFTRWLVMGCKLQGARENRKVFVSPPPETILISKKDFYQLVGFLCPQHL